RRHRSVGDNDHRRGARLFELADDQRSEIGERRLRPVDRRETVARLPIAQADEVEPGSMKEAAVLAHRELAHPLQDEQLDFRDLGQVDELVLLTILGRRGQNLHQGIATRSRMSLMTTSTVRPWLAACGPSQMRWLRMYCARSWMSSGYTSVRRRTSSVHTFARRAQQMIARGEAPRSTPCSTRSE